MRTFDLEGDFRIERLGEDKERSTDVSVLTAADGVLTVTASGSLPAVSASTARRALDETRRFVAITGQSVSVFAGNRLLLRVDPLPNGGARTALRWWSLLRVFLSARLS